jgi:hypothetical protein
MVWQVFVVLFVSCIAGADVGDTDMTHSSVKRVIDLTTHIARHTISITVQNNGLKPVDKYEIVLHKNQSDRLAAMNAFDNSGRELNIAQQSISEIKTKCVRG